MKIKTWNPEMTDKDTADLAYWERNALALYFADGWYEDNLPTNQHPIGWSGRAMPHYEGWRRVLSLEGGEITFHIPDDFDVGDLRQIDPNWDGHTTEEKWRRILTARAIELK